MAEINDEELNDEGVVVPTISPLSFPVLTSAETRQILEETRGLPQACPVPALLQLRRQM